VSGVFPARLLFLWVSGDGDLVTTGGGTGHCAHPIFPLKEERRPTFSADYLEAERARRLMDWWIGGGSSIDLALTHLLPLTQLVHPLCE